MRWAPLNRPWTWLLVLRSPAGVRERLSGQPVDVVEPDGATRRYRGGLPMIEWGWQAPVFDAAVGDKSITLSGLPLDTAGARAVSYVHHEAELSAWIIGTPFVRRILVFTGRVTAEVVGEPGEGVTLELNEAPFEDRGRLLGQQAVLRAEDWAGSGVTLVDDLDGKVLPLVLGTPGVYGSSTAPGSPAIVLGSYDQTVAGVTTTYVRLLIAEGPVVAEEVTIYSPDAPAATSSVVKAVGRVVARGRKRSYVDLQKASDFDPSITDVETLLGWSYFVIWDQGGGGLRGPDRRTMAQAGAVLEHVLRRSTLRVDYSRLAVAAQQLGAWRVDTYCDDPDMTPFQWLVANLLPFLPISLVSGPYGVYPLVWRLDQPRGRAVAHLTEGLNFWRLSRPESWDVAHAGRIEVLVGENDETGDPVRTLVHAGRLPVPAGESSSSIAVEAAARWGHDAVLAIDCRATWDTSTGWAAALSRGNVAGPDWQLLEGRVEPRLAGLEPGDLVLLNDAGLGLRDARAYVVEPTWATTHARVALVVCFTGTLR